MHNKKGRISEEVLLSIPRIIFLIAVLFAVVLLVKIFIITNIDVRQVESNILISRLLYSKDGLSYYDEDIKRLYPGIIDLNKFRQISLENPNALDKTTMSYGQDNPIIAAKITLKQENKNDVIAFYNKDRFDKWEPRTLSTVRGGAGSFKSFQEQKYVLIKDGEAITRGILKLNIIS